MEKNSGYYQQSKVKNSFSMTRCKDLGVKISMDYVGDYYGNEMAESFFTPLESALLDIVPVFNDPKHIQSKIIRYIKGF